MEITEKAVEEHCANIVFNRLEPRLDVMLERIIARITWVTTAQAGVILGCKGIKPKTLQERFGLKPLVTNQQAYVWRLRDLEKIAETGKPLS